jgi:outer membrane protein
VSREAVKSAEANCKKTKDMVNVGMTTDADFLAADVELANVNQQKFEAESSLATTVAALNITLGDKPDFEYELTGEMTEKYFPVEELEELLRIALENRPEYKRAAITVEASREQTKAVKNQKLPQVNAFGNFGYSSPYPANGSTDYTVGVSLNYTLFDAGRKARVEQAATAETIAALERENLANQIKLEVIRAAQNYKTARAKIQVSVKSIAQAEEALRIIQDRYKFGLTTFNEVLRSETALVRAKHNLLSARFQYYISYASVLLATGRLTDARVFE